MSSYPPGYPPPGNPSGGAAAALGPSGTPSGCLCVGTQCQPDAQGALMCHGPCCCPALVDTIDENGVADKKCVSRGTEGSVPCVQGHFFPQHSQGTPDQSPTSPTTWNWTIDLTQLPEGAFIFCVKFGYSGTQGWNHVDSLADNGGPSDQGPGVGIQGSVTWSKDAVRALRAAGRDPAYPLWCTTTFSVPPIVLLPNPSGDILYCEAVAS